MRSVLVIGTAALLLAGCEVSVKREGEAKAEGAAPAQSAARDGEISIDTPGFDMKLDIPAALRSQISGDSDIIYPGSQVNGLNVTADQDNGKGRSQVQMRFTSADAPAKVAAWYRDPTRAETLAGVSVQQEGPGFRIKGTGKDGGDPFDLRLSAAPGGGTQAELNLQNRS
ncbi:MAG TPA: hypothetical protein VF631_12735 [Allosphingosinicella sp.]|uniref:hypothetical protein n=1 Tax=Allosphingosinicella sp. TaxID=2823234 RepID=UPI002F29E318